VPRGHQKGQHCKWREPLDRSRSWGGDPPHALVGPHAQNRCLAKQPASGRGVLFPMPRYNSIYLRHLCSDVYICDTSDVCAPAVERASGVLPVVYCLLYGACCILPVCVAVCYTAAYLLPIAYCLLPISCCLLSVAGGSGGGSLLPMPVATHM
jgi:hypothetical protein